MQLGRRIKGVIGAIVLTITLIILAWQNVVSLSDISTPILAGIIAGIVSLLSWGFTSEKPKASFKIEINNPNDPSRQHTRLLSFKIWNEGGGESARKPTVVCKVEGQSEDEYAVKWRQSYMPIPDEIDSPEIIQNWLDDNSLFTASKIDHGGYETIELLFTTDRHNKAYFLDSNKTTLELGKHYNITLKVKATDVQAHVRKFNIDLRQWDTVNATEIA